MESNTNSQNPDPQPLSGLAKAGMALALGVLIVAISMQIGWLPRLSELMRRGAHTHVQSDRLPPARVPSAPPTPTDIPPPPPVADLPLPPIPSGDDVFVIVEQMPEMIGGLKALQKKIRYPAIAKKAGIQGRVFLQFIVDKKGNVTDPVVIRGIGAGCDEEALRALTEMKFVPGMQKGHTVRVKLSLPVMFRLR